LYPRYNLFSHLPMMFVFHQLLWVVDTIYLPSLVFSIMRISTHFVWDRLFQLFYSFEE
jgi:hypothetical protein